MKYAIVSDIHGNLEALDAVLRDLERHTLDGVLCLGDSVGYGPNPCECLDWSVRQSVYLLGNAEESVLFAPETGGESATAAMGWTREVLFTGAAGSERRRRLESLPRLLQHDEALFVHASPRSPLHEYLYPEVAQPRPRFEALLRLAPRWTFSGHTHLPGVLDVEGRFTSAATQPVWQGEGRQVLVNVGWDNRATATCGPVTPCGTARRWSFIEWPMIWKRPCGRFARSRR
jgi:predicted phosphodiesterase